MINKEWALDAYRRLQRIRLTEEAIAAEYPKQEMKCPVHLSIGQEAVAVGTSLNLDDKDVFFSSHRCHSHYLAKGGNLRAMIAELYGKKTGCAYGYGGSMHLLDDDVGAFGASAIVGGAIPLSVGAALTFKMESKTHVAVAYLGDGASEQGVFYECLNFASLKKLPVLFICENNFIATASPLEARRPKDNIFRHGDPFGIPGEKVDGNDILAVSQAVQRAVERGRKGDGPSLIEARTFRMKHHVGPETDKTSGKRALGEWDRWASNCPIKRFETLLISQRLLSKEDQNTIIDELNDQIRRAFEFAKISEPADWTP